MAGPRLLFSKRGPFYGMIDKPNSVPLRAATIYLGALLPAPSSNLPGACVPPFPDPLRGFVLGTGLFPTRLIDGGDAGDAARVAPWAPYLVLHPVGFSLPVPSPAPRCALTAPFHPCLIRNVLPRGGHRRFVLCGTVPHPHEIRFLTVAAPMRVGGC